jgi:hypothetical protein
MVHLSFVRPVASVLDLERSEFGLLLDQPVTLLWQSRDIHPPIRPIFSRAEAAISGH